MALNFVGIALSWVAILVAIPVTMGGLFFESIEAVEGGAILLFIGVVNLGSMWVLSRPMSTVVSTGLLVVLIIAIAYLTRRPEKHHR